ncbi:MAG: PQQ-binding-like beta-propeller repeat protein, partial [Blastocatellia bacterium]
GTIDGELLVDGWTFGRPAIAGDSLLIFIGSTLSSLDLSLGGIRWRQKTNGKWRTPRLHIWGDAVLAGNELGEVYAFRISDGDKQWSHDFEGIIRSIGNSQRVLYVGTRQGKVYAYISGQGSKP